MFKLKSLLSFFLLIALFSFVSFAQSTKKGAVNIQKTEKSALVSYTLTADTTNQYHSVWFSLPDYNITNIYYDKIQTSAANKPFLTAMIEGSNDQTSVYTLDTLGAHKDSLETIYKGSIDNNGIKTMYYRFNVKGEAGNRSDAVIKINLLFTKPEN